MSDMALRSNNRDDGDAAYDRAKDDRCEMIAAAIEVAEADYDYMLLIHALVANKKITDESKNAKAVVDAAAEAIRLQAQFGAKSDRLYAARARWAAVRPRT